MSEDDEPLPTMPVSPATGLDPEIRQFMSRLMAGYEAAHRSVVDLCETLSKRAEQAEGCAARALELQVKLAEEREELLSKRHRRELEAEIAKEHSQHVAELMRDFKSVLLLAGKKYFGVPLTGNDSHGLQDLLATMSAEQIESVMATGKLELSVAQRSLLASTLSSLAENEEKVKAAE